MSQPDPLVRATAPAPKPTRLPSTPARRPSRLTDASHTAGTARLAVDNQPGFDEQEHSRAPLTNSDHDRTGTSRAITATAFALPARSAQGDCDRALGRAATAIDDLERHLDSWARNDLDVSNHSDAFEEALSAAGRAERQRQLIDGIIGVLEIGKGFGQLMNLVGATRGVPSAAESVGSLGKRVPMALDITKGVRRGHEIARPTPAQPSPTLQAIAELKGDLDGVQAGVDTLYAGRAMDKAELTAISLDTARAKASDARSFLEQLRRVAPMHPALAEGAAAAAAAMKTARALTKRLATAQALATAMKASSPKALVPGSGVRQLHDRLAESPGMGTSLQIHEKRRIHAHVDERGDVVSERHMSEFLLQPRSAAAHVTLELSGIDPSHDIGAEGAAALATSLGPARVEVVGGTLTASFSSLATRSFDGKDWPLSRETRVRFVREALAAERGDTARMLGRLR